MELFEEGAGGTVALAQVWLSTWYELPDAGQDAYSLQAQFFPLQDDLHGLDRIAL